MSEVRRCSDISSNIRNRCRALPCPHLLCLIRNKDSPCDNFLPILQPCVTEEHRIDIDAMTLIQVVHDLLGWTVEPGRGQYDSMIVKIEFRQLPVEPLFKRNVQGLAQIFPYVLKNLRFIGRIQPDA